MKRMCSVAYVVKPRGERENVCLCFSLLSQPPSQKPWSRDPDLPDPSRSVILDLQDMSEWCMKSVVEPKLPVPEYHLMMTLKCNVYQCLDLTPRVGCIWKVPKVFSPFRNFEGIPKCCRKPQALTYHLCAKGITQAGLVAAVEFRREEDIAPGSETSTGVVS